MINQPNESFVLRELSLTEYNKLQADSDKLKEVKELIKDWNMCWYAGFENYHIDKMQELKQILKK